MRPSWAPGRAARIPALPQQLPLGFSDLPGQVGGRGLGGAQIPSWFLTCSFSCYSLKICISKGRMLPLGVPTVCQECLSPA